MVVPAVSPYVAICSAVALRSLSIATLVGLPVLLIVLIRRRWFCRRVCPMGLILETVGKLRPGRTRLVAKLPRIGQWVALLTLAGACVGYPLFLWMDPLAIFAGYFGLLGQPAGVAGLIAGVALPVVLILTLLWPGIWCRKICPLGATQDLLALPGRVVRQRIVRQEKSPPRTPLLSDGRPLARRSLLAMCLGVVWATATLRERRAGGSRPIRPPGSVGEQQFVGLCVRCGNCIKACPTGIIRPELEPRGIAGFLAPVIRFDESYCLEDCCRCTEVCPSGAIRRLSLEEKKKTPIGLAKVELELCLLYEDQECSACVNHCPYEAITIKFNEEQYIAEPRIDATKCPGCGACQVACPTSPKAITVHPLRVA